MVKLVDVEFGNGEVRFFGKEAAVPATVEKTENVTVHNSGREEIPAHYVVTFMISAGFEEPPFQFRSTFHLSCYVLGAKEDAPYRDVESEGARQIAPILRSIADRIDQDVAEFDQRHPTEKA